MDRSLEPALVTLLLWLLFGGSHIALAAPPLRARLVERLGRWGFLLLYYAVAIPTFTLLVGWLATHRFEGAAGLGLGATAASPWLGAVALVGMALVVVALLDYPRSAYTTHNAEAETPRGIERVTRHPFFVGLVLLGATHALLASRLVATAFMAGLTAFVLIGAACQDRKLLALRGAPYARYLEQTSTLPFAAILAGRTTLAWSDLPWVGLAAGGAAAFALRAAHGGILDHGGLWVSGAVAGGAILFALRQYWLERRSHRPTPQGVAS